MLILDIVHKCAGHTVVKLFKKIYNLHIPNVNGNPYGKKQSDTIL
jgi:hypothetical protein